MKVGGPLRGVRGAFRVDVIVTGQTNCRDHRLKKTKQLFPTQSKKKKKETVRLYKFVIIKVKQLLGPPANKEASLIKEMNNAF